MPNPVEAGVQYTREALRGVRIPAPSLKGVISNPINYLRLTLAAGAGLALSACDRPAIDPSTITQEPARPVATATISLTPGIGGGEPIATFPAGHPRVGENPGIDEANRRGREEAAKPTPTPEAKKELAPCLITSPELCAQAERIQIIRASGKTETYLAFNPDKKTPFFAPEDGRLLDKIEESGDPFSGFSALFYKPEPLGGAYRIIGLEFDNMIQVENPKKGSLVGYSNSSGITNFGARVLVTATKRTPDGPVTDEDALREVSPAAYEKPIKQTFSQTTPGKPTVSISYSPNPPQ